MKRQAIWAAWVHRRAELKVWDSGYASSMTSTRSS